MEQTLSDRPVDHFFKTFRCFFLSLVFFSGFYVTSGIYSHLTGVSLILFAAFHFTLLVLSFWFFLRIFFSGIVFRKRAKTLFLFGIGVLSALFVSEFTLKVLSMIKTDRSLQMPPEWKKRQVEIPGSVDSYYWQGKLHIHNADRFRTTGTYTVDPDAFRIVVLGDSLTYGYGVAETDAYPSLIEKELRSFKNVKVYNLGRSGDQSEDILRNARHWVPILRPNLIIYGVCMNDFLPSDKGQYVSNFRYVVPFPRRIKKSFVENTLTGALLARGYEQLLLRLKLRNNFYEDILLNFEGYQARFRKDLASMNEFVVNQTGTPALLIVLNAVPHNPEAMRISDTAEEAARKAGMQVISMKRFYEKYSSGTVQLHVSRWEQHPNEIAHRGFADMILPVVKSHPIFVNYENHVAQK